MCRIVPKAEDVFLFPKEILPMIRKLSLKLTKKTTYNKQNSLKPIFMNFEGFRTALMN